MTQVVVLDFDGVCLEESKTSCPSVDVWFNVPLHQKTLGILEMVIKNAMV